MIRMKLVKWMAASAIAIAAVPAIGLARHASHVSAAPVSADVTTSVTPGDTDTKAVKHAAVKSKTKKHKKHKAVAKKAKAKTKRHKAKKKKHAHPVIVEKAIPIIKCRSGFVFQTEAAFCR